MLRLISEMIRNTACTITGASPSEGSSSSNSRGFAIRPRATATICNWPPDKVQPSASENWRMSGNRSNIASASATVGSRARRFEPPSMMFSLTVRPGKTRRPSGTWEMPSRTMASGPRPAIDLPSNRMSPAAGFASPEIARSVVDLPAPLAPSKRHHLPFVDADRDAAQRFDLAVAHDQIADFEQRHYSVPR